MSMKLALKRGDTRLISFTVPEEIAPSGSTLYFMAKPAPDDDLNDASAVISKQTSDASPDGSGKVRFNLKLAPGDTQNIKMGGANKVEFLGELEVRTPSGEVYSIPDNNKFMKVTVYADIRRGGNG